MSVISKRYQKTNKLTLERFDQTMWAPILLGILFFFILCLGEADSIKGTVMVVAVFTLVIIAARFKVIRERIHLPFIALTLYVLMDGISTFYAVSGKFALREFLKVFLAFLLGVILLATSPKNENVKGNKIATVLAFSTAFGSLVGIDLFSTGWISGAVVWMLGRFTELYEEFGGVNTVKRMSSIFSNANVFAGVSGVGILLSLGLAGASEVRKQRNFYLVLLFLNFASFLLTISLGAFFFEGVALVVYILLQNKEKRFHALVQVLETAILAGFAATLLYGMMNKNLNHFRITPLLISAVGAVALCILDVFLGKRTATVAVRHGKRNIIIVAAIVTLIAAYAVAALCITSPITINPKGYIERVTFPDPGDYTFNVEADDDSLKLRVDCRTQLDNTYKSLKNIYSGKASGASFTVPEDSAAVYIRLSSTDGARIESASFGPYKVRLNYILAPSFVVKRLHSRNIGTDIAQRLVYFRDGLKIFKRSPIVGLGMGAFENAIKSVQPYYYETKYAHNHYFQTMLEVGIVGLLLFLLLLISSALAIWKSRKHQPFAPMLGAIWSFMAGQALHDIVFSSYAYLPIAYGSFILINHCCGEYIPRPKLAKTVKTITLGVIAACSIVYCGFLAGNMMAKRNVDQNPTLQALTQSVKLDRFEWADYALPYVVNATGDNVNVYVRQQADIYAERLAQVDSNTIPIYLAEYYFCSDRMEQGLAMVEKYVDYVASDQNAWIRAFQLLSTYDDGSEMYHSGVVRIARKLDAWNTENTGTIKLDEASAAYIESCMA